MATPSEGCRLVVSPRAGRALSSELPEKVALAALAFISGTLLEHPRRLGKELESPFAPAYVARRGDYRIIYLIDEVARVVKIVSVSHRGDAYRS